VQVVVATKRKKKKELLACFCYMPWKWYMLTFASKEKVVFLVQTMAVYCTAQAINPN